MFLSAKNGSHGNYKGPHRRFIQLPISSLVGQLGPNIDRIERSHWPFDAVSKTSSNGMYLAFLIQHAFCQPNLPASIVCILWDYYSTVQAAAGKPTD